MSAAAPASLTVHDPRILEEALIARFDAAGYVRLDPPILQPADVFLDLSGESIRRSMFLTADAEGHELCLRPDLTIPVARAVLGDQLPLPAAVSYLGPVFRFRGEGSGEFRQAGVESFGRTDIEATDAEILALGLDVCTLYGVEQPEIRLGDVGLFAALLDALPLAPALRRRLLKDFGQGRLGADFSRPLADGPATAHSGVLNALAGADPEAARALITDLLSIAGISTVGGRTVSEIAERFLEQASLEAGGLSAETAAILARYLAITGQPDAASADMRALSRDAGIALDRALDLFDRRTGFLTAHDVNLADVRFSTAFGRPLDYYSGMVFELHDPAGRAAGALVAGGRYDRLLPRLGASSEVTGVGLAAWVDRLAALDAFTFSGTIR
ncbi:ATP phosphoribosyltransferase regulatory subunit [Xanthobacter agilis]|uniref:Histidine--tRNA ligase n=1 Tax=Xanthobacter agilis TaxID=47492 RepID=A0ABU0LH96_XANAG|nr:ATP phosphoribosyltransferase regulatory subunit [Xanthobacter agilis]MDQ0506508.1 ATP phosphoribosyltransferase regulatory subunit [Xanthobacter agilis]